MQHTIWNLERGFCRFGADVRDSTCRLVSVQVAAGRLADGDSVWAPGPRDETCFGLSFVRMSWSLSLSCHEQVHFSVVFLI